jgi:hypothetical protein
MIRDPESGPATPAQRALIVRLAHDHPEWADRLNGDDWESCFDVLDRTKFVSATEASSVITALLTLVARAEDEPCARGTEGCSVAHVGSENCETW